MNLLVLVGGYFLCHVARAQVTCVGGLQSNTRSNPQSDADLRNARGRVSNGASHGEESDFSVTNSRARPKKRRRLSNAEAPPTTNPNTSDEESGGIDTSQSASTSRNARRDPRRRRRVPSVFVPRVREERQDQRRSSSTPGHHGDAAHDVPPAVVRATSIELYEMDIESLKALEESARAQRLAKEAAKKLRDMEARRRSAYERAGKPIDE